MRDFRHEAISRSLISSRTNKKKQQDRSYAIPTLSPASVILLFLVLSSDRISVANAFMNPSSPLTSSTSSPASLIQLQQRHSYSHKQQHKSLLTSCQMVATKSGGKPILSIEQFESEVLLRNNDDNSDDEQDQDKKQQPILVLYSAPWCGPCRLTNPIVQQISKRYEKLINVVEVCTDDLPTIAESAGVVSIPTLQLYYDGRCYDTIVGCVTINVLSSALDKVLDDLGLLLVRSDDDSNDNSDDNKIMNNSEDGSDSE